MQFASVLVVFLLIIDKIRYLRLLGLFLNSSSCLQHFLIKLSCLLLLPLGRKKIHFPRIFTLKPVTSLHTNILIHSRASQGQPAKGRSGYCRGVNHFNPNIKAKEKINHQKIQARAWASVSLAGKDDSCRHSTTSFSGNGNKLVSRRS